MSVLTIILIWPGIGEDPPYGCIDTFTYHPWLSRCLFRYSRLLGKLPVPSVLFQLVGLLFSFCLVNSIKNKCEVVWWSLECWYNCFVVNTKIMFLEVKIIRNQQFSEEITLDFYLLQHMVIRHLVWKIHASLFICILIPPRNANQIFSEKNI